MQDHIEVVAVFLDRLQIAHVHTLGGDGVSATYRTALMSTFSGCVQRCCRRDMCWACTDPAGGHLPVLQRLSLCSMIEGGSPVRTLCGLHEASASLRLKQRTL